MATDQDLTARLLDPFAGCATSLVIAKYLGIPSIGYEPHPVFARIARAKIDAHLCQAHISEIGGCISRGFAKPYSSEYIPDSPRRFLQKLFAPEVLAQLLGARQELLRENLNSDLSFDSIEDS
jgi:hypothetical protein